jgi:hypothetical protein
VPVDDIHTHPRELDLVIGTHGRSAYVLDGVHVFEQWTPKALTDTLTAFAPRAAWAWHRRPISGYFGTDEWSAKNPPFGAWFDYFLPREVEGGVSVAVEDSTGKTVRTLQGPGEPGFHRVVWDLVPGEPRQRIRRTELTGQPLLARPGRYRVRLRAGRAAPREHTFELKAIPGTYLSEL